MRICPSVSEADICGFTIINKFTRKITMTISIIVKTIRDQLFASGATKVWSWGAHAWIQMDALTLQFKVQGRHFHGHVRIAYDEGDDLYIIHFGHWRNRQWKNLETIEGVYCDTMVDFIDKKVEYIDKYKNR